MATFYDHFEALRGIPLQRTSIAIPWPAKHNTLRNIADRVAGLSLRRKTGPGTPEAVLADAQPGGTACGAG